MQRDSTSAKWSLMQGIYLTNNAAYPNSGSGFKTGLENLAANTEYALSVAVLPAMKRSRVARFVTPPLETEARTVTFGATSCLSLLGRPFPVLSRAASRKLDFMALLGDTIYADQRDTPEELQMGIYTDTGCSSNGCIRSKWRSVFDTDGARDLFSSTSVIATWCVCTTRNQHPFAANQK